MLPWQVAPGANFWRKNTLPFSATVVSKCAENSCWVLHEQFSSNRIWSSIQWTTLLLCFVGAICSFKAEKKAPVCTVFFISVPKNFGTLLSKQDHLAMHLICIGQLETSFTTRSQEETVRFPRFCPGNVRWFDVQTTSPASLLIEQWRPGGLILHTKRICKVIYELRKSRLKLHIWIFGSPTSVTSVQHQHQDPWAKSRIHSQFSNCIKALTLRALVNLASELSWWLFSATELPRCYCDWTRGQAPETLASGAYGARKDEEEQRVIIDMHGLIQRDMRFNDM